MHRPSSGRDVTGANAPLNELQSAVKDDDLKRAATAASEIRVLIAEFLRVG